MSNMTKQSSKAVIANNVYIFYLLLYSTSTESKNLRELPINFLIGTATSSYQIEGAWDQYGKGESMWDHLVHSRPELVNDQSNGDVACDSYHKIKEDVALLKKLGMQHYRFSISWSRVLPNGFENNVNKAAIKYYNQLIDALIAEEIIPMVTIYHWELPQVLQDLGGWINPDIKFWFRNYARVLFQHFGDRVKTWITINEPKQMCVFGYGEGTFAPAYNFSGIADYLCTYNVLLAHAHAYHLYRKEFKEHQRGRVGITVECAWSEPGSNSAEDKAAADRMRQFDFGIYTNPIFHAEGDFPDVVKKFVHRRSLAEGFTQSRLPILSPAKIKFIKGTCDFLGVNHYTTSLIKAKAAAPIGDPSRAKDVQVEIYADPSWLTGSIPYFRLVPWGVRKLLKYLKDNYGNPEIIITENGFPDYGEIDDVDRIMYHKETLVAILDAIHNDEVNVTGYTVWSLMDNFEWLSGYTTPFGLYHVNFTDVDRRRTPKSSCRFFEKLLSTRIVSAKYD